MIFSKIIVWYLAIYGMSWALVHSQLLEGLRSSIEGLLFYFTKSPFLKWLSYPAGFLVLVLHCIVCTSFWCALAFVFDYFPSETMIVKVLISFSNVAFTWILASSIGDLE